jgi:hypothetical protein
MASSFEILLLREEIRGPSGSSSRLYLETLPETDEFLDTLLEPFGRNSFELIGNLNVSFRQSNFWPWGVVAFEREYRLAGHVCASRHNPRDVLFTGYSVRTDYSVARTGPPPVSMLFFHSKLVVSTLASQSPLFSACWSILADKPQNRNWLCVPDPLPESWVTEAEKVDAALFSRANAT